MTLLEFENRLVDRAAAAQVHVATDAIGNLHQYFELLSRWNARINLTALPLDPPTPRTFDRLFLEPIAASRSLTDLPGQVWFDVGSGGGSPAVPLSIIRPELRLTMIEAREKKAAFLREVVRAIGLNASVEAVRFQDLARTPDASPALATARAIRTGLEFWSWLRARLVAGAVVAIFGGEQTSVPPDGFEWLPCTNLLAGPGSHLLRAIRVSRGTM